MIRASTGYVASYLQAVWTRVNDATSRHSKLFCTNALGPQPC